VLDVSILPLFTILILDFGKVPTVWYFLYFLFFNYNINIVIHESILHSNNDRFIVQRRNEMKSIESIKEQTGITFLLS
jgi:hypothetical protein